MGVNTMLQQGIRAMRCVISLILLIGVLSCSDTNQSLPGSVGAFDTGADITTDAETMTSQWPLATPSEPVPYTHLTLPTNKNGLV